MDRLLNVLSKLNIPIRYVNTREKLSLPFALYSRQRIEPMRYDNQAFSRFFSIQLEIYYENLKEQIKLEKQLEQLLNNHRYFYEKTEDDIVLDDKKTMVVYYDIGGLINDKRN